VEDEWIIKQIYKKNDKDTIRGEDMTHMFY